MIQSIDPGKVLILFLLQCGTISSIQIDRYERAARVGLSVNHSHHDEKWKENSRQ